MPLIRLFLPFAVTPWQPTQTNLDDVWMDRDPPGERGQDGAASSAALRPVGAFGTAVDEAGAGVGDDVERADSDDDRSGEKIPC